jgi:hypothetical protein|tara:strand:- start:5492 stop:5917 length:426 start_codon:yes stop_codon:yes gene_type:complete
MADITVTAADVRPLQGAITRRFTAGGTVAIGDLVYVASDGDVEKADADAAASSIIAGVAVGTPDGGSSASAGEEVDVVVFGPVTGFSSMTAGPYAFASTTAGKAETGAPAAASGDYVGILGIIISATVILVNPFTYDVTAQ